MPLDRYRELRDFARTPEPSPGEIRGGSGRFVVHRHRASRLHYDLRLEVEGVLASWAVPRGPSLDPDVRRLAQRTEDHPIEYLDFEGVIPSGAYGAGDMIAWDWGRFEPEGTDDPAAALAAGELKFSIRGEKLRGRFTIVRTGGRRDASGRVRDPSQWLLLHKRDEHAVLGWDPEAKPRSVRSGLTNEEVAADAIPRFTARPPAPEAVVDLSSAARAKLPTFIRPMLATPVDGPFTDPEWLFEVKWDGYRIEAVIRAGVARLWTRNRVDASGYAPELAGPANWIAAEDAIVDGELVAVDEHGHPSFSLLQERSGLAGLATRRGERRQAPPRGDPAGVAPDAGPDVIPTAVPVVYWAFDLLHLDGHALLDLPLEARKALLRRVLRPHPIVRFAPHVVEDGEAYLAAIRDQGLEGMLAKRRSSRYQPGRRSDDWLKVKLHLEQELVVVGWLPRTGSADDLGSLVTAVHEGTQLRLAGQVGSGLDARSRAQLAGLLRPLERPAAVIDDAPRLSGVRWVDPRVVIRVSFSEWTRDGLLRQPVFLGVDPGREVGSVRREQAEAAERVLSRGRRHRAGAGPRAAVSSGAGERARSSGTIDLPSPAPIAASELASLDAMDRDGPWEVAGRVIRLTNLDKVLFPGATDLGVAPATKRDLVRYYARVAHLLVPLLADRGLTVRRFPDGVARAGFWQKDAPAHTPAWVRGWTYHHRSDGPKTYPVVDQPATLIWLAQEAAVELHPWTSTTSAPDEPSYALIDIDPGSATSWEETLVLARLFRTALDHLGVVGLPKVTGMRGLHVWIPVRAGYTFDETRDWVERLSRAVGASAPELVSWEWSKGARAGRARLDYTQNALNRTLAAPYAVRAAPAGPISMPIRWDELDDPDLRPDRWNLRDAPERIAAVGDLFGAARAVAQELPPL
jgi:bifunctional non-homologous end joining protein LigD